MKRQVRIPYSGTKISPEQTKGEIEKLLKEHGIQDIQWTTYHGETTLKFIYGLDFRGVHKEIMFSFTPQNIPKTVRQYNPKIFRTEKIKVNDEPVAYRLLWWYLKAKLEAVSYGLESVEKEFLSHILLSLPNGQQATIGEKIFETLTTIEEHLALPETKPPVDTSKVIDVEVEKE
jgi:hypothetical protein